MSLTLTAIILNWNGRHFLGGALRSLAAQTEPAERTVVVDNASADGSVAYVRDHFPGVDVIPLPANRGWPAGNNAALRQFDSDIALLLNPDVELDPACLAALRGAFADDATIGIAGALLYELDGQTIQHAGGIITRPQALAAHHGLGEADTGQFESRRDVDYVIGAALAIRRPVWEAIGPLDEGYFLYFEDADYCARARAAGWRVVYEPGARVIHHESALTGRDTPFYFRYMHHGRWRYLLKHWPLETLLNETAPAERAWLDRVSFVERRAAVRAYRTAWAQWPAIAAGRALATADVDAVADLLRSLIAAAWPAPETLLASPPGIVRLQAAAEVRERPFRSAVPLAGPLIAGLRGLWHRIAARAYIQPQLAAQNDFNRLVADQLAALTAADDAAAASLESLEARFLDRLLRPPENPVAIEEIREQLRIVAERINS